MPDVKLEKWLKRLQAGINPVDGLKLKGYHPNIVMVAGRITGTDNEARESDKNG